MEKIATVVLKPSAGTHICLDQAGGNVGRWDGELGGFTTSLYPDCALDYTRESGGPPMYSLHVYFPGPVKTRTRAGSPSEDVDNDCVRYYLLYDLAGDGAPVGVVAGLWCRGVRLESGAWELTLWAQDNKDIRAHVLNDFRGAV